MFTRSVCEHKTLTLSCNKGYILKVHNANYGRTSEHHCGSHLFYNQTCNAATSTEIVKQQCDGKKYCCITASNNIFGDPCKYTVKYLKVQYSCVKVCF